LVENRYVLYGLVAGSLAGAVSASITAYLVLTGVFSEVINDVVVASGGSPSLIPKSIMASIERLALITLVAVIIQYAILGALIALIESYLVGKGVRESVASLITGLTFVGINLGVLGVANYVAPAPTEAVLKHIPLLVALAPSITYAVAISVLSTVKGPWVRWGRGEPSTY